jgi:NhaP-type Na+/H+ or K+/H+ antiporter
MRDPAHDLALPPDRRRRVWTAVAAVALPAALLAIGSTGHLEYGFVLIALVFPALFVYGQIHGRRTREGTDERARQHHREAASFSLQVMALVLLGATVWTQIRHGLGAAEPYLLLAGTLAVSYTGALLWRRWRD